MTVADLRPPRKIKAQEMDFATAEYTRNEWRYTAPHGVTLDDIRSPEFWSHVARKLRGGDRIEVMAADGSYDCDYRVVSVLGLLVKLRPLREWMADEGEQQPVTDQSVEIRTSQATVRHVKGAHKWRVQNAAGEVVRHGFDTRGEAEAAMHEYLVQIDSPVAA